MENTVFAVFVNDEGKILSLKRSPDKEWYPNKWDVISGKIHGGESPEECLRREVLEEIGISDFEIVRKMHTHEYEEKGKMWLVHPFLCRIKSGSVVIDSEHQEFRWLGIQELLKLEHALPLKIELGHFSELF